MSKIIRYDMNYFPSKGMEAIHPQKQLIKDGMKEIRSEAVPIADCWFFEVEILPDPLPEWYTIVEAFKFSQ